MSAAALVPAGSMRCAVLIPTFDNPVTVRSVVQQVRRFVPDVIVVDDGSGSAGRAACEAIAADGLAYVHHRERNGGKGAAVKTGFVIARELGFSHVLQVDADGQHDLAAIPTFLHEGRQDPRALVLGCPRYDASVPRHREVARKFTRFWVDLEVGRGVIVDSMVGFRLYPLALTELVRVAGNWMDFDIEIAVRLAWQGTRIVNVPVGVRYLDATEGGVSHFRLLADNLRFTWLHSKLCATRCTLWALHRLGLRRRRLPA